MDKLLSVIEKEQLEVDVAVAEDIENALIVHNDDVNTFDWVIESLMDICKHTFEQAEQCSLLIHFQGKYAVKHGQMDELKPMKE